MADGYPWFRLWVGCGTHDKVLLLNDSERWTWVRCVEMSSNARPRGTFMSTKLAAEKTGRSLKHINRLVDVGLIDRNMDGSLVMHDWHWWQVTKPSRGSAPSNAPDGAPSDASSSGLGKARPSSSSVDLSPEKSSRTRESGKTETDDAERAPAHERPWTSPQEVVIMGLLAAHPERDESATLNAFAVYVVGLPKPPRSITACFQRWLEREPLSAEDETPEQRWGGRYKHLFNRVEASS